MSTTPSATPVLRGRDGAVLRHRDDALTLRQGDEETRIPLAAVRAVTAGDRSVAVELATPAGAVPTVIRVEGVQDAAAALFATALAERPEPDPSVDGAALLTTRALRAPRTRPGPTARARGLAWLVLMVGPGLVVLIGGGAAAVVRGGAAVIVNSLLTGLLTVLLNLVSWVATERSYRMWQLPRRGITVMAVRRSPFGANGTYDYTDLHGASHAYFRKAYADEIEVCYDPADPGLNIGLYPVPVRVLVTCATVVLWAATAGTAG